MHDDVYASQCAREPGKIADVADQEAEALVLVGQAALQLGLLQLVPAVHANRLGSVLCEKRLDEGAAE